MSKILIENDEYKDYPPLLERIFYPSKCDKISDFRVLQWNILADALVGHFHVPPQCLEWSFRSIQIMRKIELVNADIICLEEVDHYYDFFEPKLSMNGYKGTFLPKKESPCLKFPGNNGPDGAAIFYRKTKFELVEAVKEYLHEEDGNVGTKCLVIVVLRHLESDKLLLCGVTHFKSSTGFEEKRYAQGKSAYNKFVQLSKKYSNAGIIFCGDFNGNPSEPYFKVFTESTLDLKSAYHSGTGNEIEYTGWSKRHDINGGDKPLIDFVFHSKSHLQVINTLLKMDDEDVPLERFPYYNHPSDHLELCFDFKIL